MIFSLRILPWFYLHGGWGDNKSLKPVMTKFAGKLVILAELERKMAVCPWVNCLTSLCLSLLHYKKGLKLEASHRVLLNSKQVSSQHLRLWSVLIRGSWILLLVFHVGGKANRPAPGRGMGTAGRDWLQGTRGSSRPDTECHRVVHINMVTCTLREFHINKDKSWLEKKNNLGHVSFLHQILWRLPDANPNPHASRPHQPAHTCSRRGPEKGGGHGQDRIWN